MIAGLLSVLTGYLYTKRFGDLKGNTENWVSDGDRGKVYSLLVYDDE